MPKYAKGSLEMKQFMEKVRSAKKNKKGDGFLGDVVRGGTKFLKNELINRAPLPQFLKNPVSNLADKGIDMVVDKTGLGLHKKRNKKRGGALNLP